MKSTRSRGFTLIELLVVIAIIGLLASIILASLNTAQQKGRDARRVSDLQEIGQAMVAADSGSGVALGCTTSGSLVNTCGTTGLNLSGYQDPSSSAACSKSSTTPCNYTEFTASPTTENYEVCAYLEAGSGNLTHGMVYVAASTSGSVEQGCP